MVCKLLKYTPEWKREWDEAVAQVRQSTFLFKRDFMDYHLLKYTPEWKREWDEAVAQVRQSTFLFKRDFMDYHRDRFEDVSLLVIGKNNQICALFPANVSRYDSKTVESHGGLTYGGLLLLPQITVSETGEIMSLLLEYYRQSGFTQLRYKPVPTIYHTYPAEEDLYWLFRNGARLESRAVSSVIDLRQPYPWSTLRKRKVKKALASKLQLVSGLDFLPAFWQMLHDVLQQRHATVPVHSLPELQQLTASFPDCIQLYVAVELAGDIRAYDNHVIVVAGCLLFVTEKVVHVQYIASSDRGCEIGALDWLFSKVIEQCSRHAVDTPYFDFGISTEKGGTFLNEGLIFQKEGFGARAVCYDSYLLEL